MTTATATPPASKRRRAPAKQPALGYQPTRKQAQIWKIIGNAKPGSRSLIGYGGAAGGGKTRALAELAYDLALEFPGNKILIGRKDFSDLRTTTMEQFDMHVPPEIVFRKNNTENWRKIRRKEWPAGLVSTVQFRELKDFLGLGSEEYGAILIDEGGEVPEQSALMLLSRLRFNLPPAAQKMGYEQKFVFCAASNPWPGWFKSWFVDRNLPEEQLRGLQAKVHFIPALARDNPYLDPSYEAFLRTIYPADWVKRLMDGDWDVYVGQVYPSFNRIRHAWMRRKDGELEMPIFERLIGGLDFGEPSNTAHKSAGIVAGVWNGRLIRLAEFEEAGPDVALRQISWMMEQERIWGQFMKKPAGIPRDEWSPRVEWRADKTQMAIIQVLKQHFYLKASKGGPNSVRWGIRLVAERLAERNGSPGSYYLPYDPTTGLGCKAFPEAMERYRWPDTDGTKAPPTTPLKVDDDLVDADRYMHEALDQPVGDPAVLYKNQLPSAIQGADLVGNIIDLFAAEAFTP